LVSSAQAARCGTGPLLTALPPGISQRAAEECRGDRRNADIHPGLEETKLILRVGVTQAAMRAYRSQLILYRWCFTFTLVFPVRRCSSESDATMLPYSALKPVDPWTYSGLITYCVATLPLLVFVQQPIFPLHHRQSRCQCRTCRVGSSTAGVTTRPHRGPLKNLTWLAQATLDHETMPDDGMLLLFTFFLASSIHARLQRLGKECDDPLGLVLARYGCRRLK
jgi:hypothetical protein